MGVSAPRMRAWALPRWRKGSSKSSRVAGSSPGGAALRVATTGRAPLSIDRIMAAAD